MRYPPPQIAPMQQRPGLMDLAKQFAMQKGANMAIGSIGGPQGAMAGELFNAVRPALGFNEGGQAPESKWDRLMRQWAELKGAMQNEELQNSMGKIKEGLGTTAGQQQLQRAALPLAAQAYRNEGGRAPLGGGQTRESLMEARKLGALTQKEFLKAMAHAGYKNAGGKVQMGPLASHKYKTMNKGGEVHEYEKKYHNPLAGGSTSKEK